MWWYLSLALLASLSFVIADTQFDICNFEDAFPEFYYDYGIKECPPVFYLADNGVDCQEFELDKKTFASFCQLKTMFYYGQERPFARIPVCRGPMTCRITESVHQAYGWKAKVNGNFKKDALTMGITGGYNDKSGYAQSYSFTKILDDNTCGYWTFVPYVRQSCGTYTTSCENQRRTRSSLADNSKCLRRSACRTQLWRQASRYKDDPRFPYLRLGRLFDTASPSR